MQDLALWLAIAGLALLMLDPRRRTSTAGGLSVTGGSVSIDASNPVETRTVWRYDGPAGPYIYDKPPIGGVFPSTFEMIYLEPGRLYSKRVSRQWMGRFRGIDVTQYDRWWVTVIATAQEQQAARCVEVIEYFQEPELPKTP